MKKYKAYYKKIFDKLIPASKLYNTNCFSKNVNIDKFFLQLKLIDEQTYLILSKKKCKIKDVKKLIGNYLIEAYFLSKKVIKYLKLYEKKNFKEEKYNHDEIYFLKNLKNK